MPSVCLIYPNARGIGVSNLGFQKIYRTLQETGAETDIAFYEEGKKTAPENSRRSLSSFTMLAFSVTFELDYLNVLKVLKDEGIPLRAEERDERHPIICLGGVAPSMNPEPMAPFADLFVIGDGEGAVPELVDAVTMDKADALRALHGREGFYVPALHRPDDRVKRLINLHYSATGMAQLNELGEGAFMNAFLIEAGKGCGQGCRFCATGYIYRPVRHVKADTIKRMVDEGLETHKRIGLVGSAICEHPEMESVYDHILDKGGEVTVSSLRIGLTPRRTLERLAKGGCKSIAIAPEAGSERMRRVVNKTIDEEEILQTVHDAVAAGIPNVKNYFLVGLPTETEEDLQAIVDLVRRMQKTFIEASKPTGHAGRLSISVNPFIPKPTTPFQWEPMLPQKELKKKIAFIKKGVARLGNLDFRSEGLKGAAAQALFSLGGRETADLLEQALNGEPWSRILKTGYARKTVFTLKDPTRPLPWEFIDTGVDRAFLLKEHEKAMKEKTTPPCPPEGTGCKRCGLFEGVCL